MWYRIINIFVFTKNPSPKRKIKQLSGTLMITFFSRINYSDQFRTCAGAHKYYFNSCTVCKVLKTSLLLLTRIIHWILVLDVWLIFLSKSMLRFSWFIPAKRVFCFLGQFHVPDEVLYICEKGRCLFKAHGLHSANDVFLQILLSLRSSLQEPPGAFTSSPPCVVKKNLVVEQRTGVNSTDSKLVAFWRSNLQNKASKMTVSGICFHQNANDGFCQKNANGCFVLFKC